MLFKKNIYYNIIMDYDNINTRRERAFSQPIYFLRMDNTKSQYEKKFIVVGTSGNKYIVKIGKELECTCPDFIERYNICKHIYFIMLRVMKVTGNIKRTNKKEILIDYFKNIPHFMNDNLAYNQNSKYNYENQFNNMNCKCVDQKIDDICPVCLVELDDKIDKNDLYYCKYSCGKSVHKSCFNTWVNSGENNNKCIFCRAIWNILIDENQNQNDDYIKLKIKELKELCQKNNLPVYGTKNMLITRLNNLKNN